MKKVKETRKAIIGSDISFKSERAYWQEFLGHRILYLEGPFTWGKITRDEELRCEFYGRDAFRMPDKTYDSTSLFLRCQMNSLTPRNYDLNVSELCNHIEANNDKRRNRINCSDEMKVWFIFTTDAGKGVELLDLNEDS